MSATNRSDVRRKDDHYVTPDWAVRRFLEAYTPPAGTWLDPCAANGELIVTARSAAAPLLIEQFVAVELRVEAAPHLAKVVPGAYVIGDFFTVSQGVGPQSFDFTLSNPPYSLAVPFLAECRRISKVVAFLLRIGFYCGGRGPLSREAKPGLFFLPNRPSFTGGGADASEYAWFVYGDPSVSGRHFCLPETPAQEITAWNKRARSIHAPQLPTLPPASAAA